jgi:hypothetical protein
MQEQSEEQILSRLLELDNAGQAERRTQLSGERYLSLIIDPDTGRGYVLQHGVDDTEGAEIPEGTEFYAYPTAEAAGRAYDQLLAESAQAGEVVEEDSTDDEGDFETSGAEVRDLYSDEDTDPLISSDGPGDPLIDRDDDVAVAEDNVSDEAPHV